ncbi:hypothetical protein GJU89_06905 [Brucella sp. 09RB8918]|nr:hypothetical protein [Brucella sp. 09RB8918]
MRLTCADGRTVYRVISHIQRGYGLPDGICVLSYTIPAPTATDTELVTVHTQVRFGPNDIWRNEVFVGERSRSYWRRNGRRRKNGRVALRIVDWKLKSGFDYTAT